MGKLAPFVAQSDNPFARQMVFVLHGMVDEIAEELSDMDELATTLIMGQIGLLLQWIATGEDETLSPALRIFLDRSIERSEEIVVTGS